MQQLVESVTNGYILNTSNSPGTLEIKTQASGRVFREIRFLQTRFFKANINKFKNRFIYLYKLFT